MINPIAESEISMVADSTIFSKDAILKCLYWYGDKFRTSLSFLNDREYLIKLTPLDNTSIKKDELEYFDKKLQRDLIDFQLRDTIDKETKNIRELLVAKAFSNGEYNESAPGEISDPVGFDPNDLS
jgi:His-Xaa-Ser system protein HxsD